MWMRHVGDVFGPRLTSDQLLDRVLLFAARAVYNELISDVRKHVEVVRFTKVDLEEDAQGRLSAVPRMFEAN
jgi:hypothetical protein